MAESTSPHFRDRAPRPQALKRVPDSERPFGRRNFILMLVSLLLIAIGFILMAGPGSSPETGFNPDIFSTRRIVVGPTMAFIGFLLMAFAIVIPPVKKQSTHNK
ncbi:MAG: DUF3098 domain-containing protein [Muribaculaceae bacterium]|nr:DUF3098 domain-containing protein [Muribaculaceae bacterium]